MHKSYKIVQTSVNINNNKNLIFSDNVHYWPAAQWVTTLKPPFLRDTQNELNSRNRGVENGKWEVSFYSEMIRLIFAQNLSNSVVLSIKCWAKSIFYLLFLQNVALLAFWGHTFAVWMPFSALQCEEMFAERPLSCLVLSCLVGKFLL